MFGASGWSMPRVAGHASRARCPPARRFAWQEKMHTRPLASWRTLPPTSPPAASLGSGASVSTVHGFAYVIFVAPFVGQIRFSLCFECWECAPVATRARWGRNGRPNQQITAPCRALGRVRATRAMHFSRLRSPSVATVAPWAFLAVCLLTQASLRGVACGGPGGPALRTQSLLQARRLDREDLLHHLARPSGRFWWQGSLGRAKANAAKRAETEKDMEAKRSRVAGDTRTDAGVEVTACMAGTDLPFSGSALPVGIALNASAARGVCILTAEEATDRQAQGHEGTACPARGAPARGQEDRGSQEGRERGSPELTARGALAIFLARKQRSGRQDLSSKLADRFGVSSKTVRNIWNLRTWAETTRPLWSPAEVARGANKRRSAPKAHEATAGCSGTRAQPPAPQHPGPVGCALARNGTKHAPNATPVKPVCARAAGNGDRGTGDARRRAGAARQDDCETKRRSSRGVVGQDSRRDDGRGGTADAEAVHWSREEVRSEALVQEGDVKALLEHLANTYQEKHGERATEDDLRVWGECLRSMRVDCTEVIKMTMPFSGPCVCASSPLVLR